MPSLIRDASSVQRRWNREQDPRRQSKDWTADVRSEGKLWYARCEQGELPAMQENLERTETMSNMPFISIDYTDGDQSSYRAVVLDLPAAGKLRFETGDLAEDHKAAMVRYFLFLKGQGIRPEDGVLMGSSSMDSFLFDGDQWVESPLVLEVETADGAVVEYELEGYARA